MKRYKPSATRQADLLTEWENRCAYCRLPFGLFVWKQGIGAWTRGQGHERRYYKPNHGAIALRLEWEHFVPFAYSGSSADSVFLPACHLCNMIKSDKVFRTIEGAREYIEPIWLRRYETATGPASSWAVVVAQEAADSPV